MKYIATTTSANFGNMVSMALASMFLPILPCSQSRSFNLLSDLPSLAIAGDNVDLSNIQRPRRWDMRYVRRFMITFGLVSSAFDLVTFVFLLGILQAVEATFQTGWFVGSLSTELAIILTIRTKAVFWQSRPSAPCSPSLCLICLLRPIRVCPATVTAIAGPISITLMYVAACAAAKLNAFRRRRANG